MSNNDFLAIYYIDTGREMLAVSADAFVVEEEGEGSLVDTYLHVGLGDP